MKTAKKAIALAMCAVFLVVGSVAGTMAYLADSDTVTNTFTVGNVDIKLDEVKVDNDGYGQPINENGTEVSGADLAEKIVNGQRVEGNANTETNTYKLIPGHQYAKDPQIVVVKGSERAYIRMLVEVENINKVKLAFPNHETNNVFLLENFVDVNVTDWEHVECTTENNVATYEFRLKTVVDARIKSEDVRVNKLFTTITIPGETTNADLEKLNEGLNINVTAHAIQADGFDDANAAWTAFDNANVVEYSPSSN